MCSLITKPLLMITIKFARFATSSHHNILYKFLSIILVAMPLVTNDIAY